MDQVQRISHRASGTALHVVDSFRQVNRSCPPQGNGAHRRGLLLQHRVPTSFPPTVTRWAAAAAAASAWRRLLAAAAVVASLAAAPFGTAHASIVATLPTGCAAAAAVAPPDAAQSSQSAPPTATTIVAAIPPSFTAVASANTAHRAATSIAAA